MSLCHPCHSFPMISRKKFVSFKLITYLCKRIYFKSKKWKRCNYGCLPPSCSAAQQFC